LFFEAVPIDVDSTFIHFSYAYSYGMMARVGMRAYLATLGGDKVGFTVTGKGRGGEALYVDGVRGVLERNTMRYYLAIEASLDALNVDPAARVDKALGDWFDRTERHPRQLHEVSKSQMKREEYRRQRSEVPPAP
jgi:hypothetical protein